MQKYAPQGIVAQTFSLANGYVPAQGDVVGLTASMTVSTTGFVGAPIGQVATISWDKTTVVVEVFASQIIELIAGTAGVTFGAQLKSSTANTVVVAAVGTTATDVPLAFGRALNTAAAGATVFVLPSR